MSGKALVICIIKSVNCLYQFPLCKLQSKKMSFVKDHLCLRLIKCIDIRKQKSEMLMRVNQLFHFKENIKQIAYQSNTLIYILY